MSEKLSTFDSPEFRRQITQMVAGNGDTYGAIVSNQASMNGNGCFQFDLSLANTFTTSSWDVTKWREFSTSTDRAIYADKLNF